ncbi:MAG: DUF535 family protein [Proteobacteria bacterium]|nr:DUF535 family protein [Pseudomonadota bacterium]
MREPARNHEHFTPPRSSTLNVARAVYAATTDRVRTKGIRRSLRSSAKLLFNLKSLWELVGILHEPNSIALARRHPGLIYKYQSHYLARSFSRSQRKAILKFHYEFMGKAVNARFYTRLMAGNIELWRSAEDQELVTISLRVPEFGREGDLSLILEIDGKQIYELSFTIIPGSVVGIPASSAMFIARVQGRKGRFDEIKRAIKICRDVSPPYLLMAAAEGIANDLRIGFAVGVGNGDQVSRHKTFDYTSFWGTLLCRKAGGRFYILPLPMSGAPLEQCNPSHRRRTRLKREFKVGLSQVVEKAFLRELKNPSLSSGIIEDGEGVKGSAVPCLREVWTQPSSGLVKRLRLR